LSYGALAVVVHQAEGAQQVVIAAVAEVAVEALMLNTCLKLVILHLL
jgi:hypothetical protein